MATHKFNLKDGAGAEHQYTVHTHPGGEGKRIVFALAPSVVESVSLLVDQHRQFVRSHIAEAKRRKDKGEDNEPTETTLADIIDQLLEDEDLKIDAIGRAVAEVMSADNADALVDAIFKHTFRDGKPLEQPRIFDQAFDANYGEMMQALRKVVTINGFLVFFGGRSATDTSVDEAQDAPKVAAGR